MRSSHPLGETRDEARFIFVDEGLGVQGFVCGVGEVRGGGDEGEDDDDGRRLGGEVLRDQLPHADYYDPIFKADGDNQEKEEVLTIPLKTSPSKEGDGEEEAEEETECGFCLFMKGGGCKDPFVAWEKCIREKEEEKSGEDVVELCHKITSLLKDCLNAHADYYEPILKAEKAMADQ